MATALILLVVTLVAIGLITTAEGSAKRRSEYYEEKNKEFSAFGKRNSLPRGYPDRVLALPTHTHNLYQNDLYATARNHDQRRKKQANAGNQRLTATLLFAIIIILALAYASVLRERRTATGHINKAELYLKY